jgi:hypothetical protein
MPHAVDHRTGGVDSPVRGIAVRRRRIAVRCAADITFCREQRMFFTATKKIAPLTALGGGGHSGGNWPSGDTAGW